MSSRALLAAACVACACIPDPAPRPDGSGDWGPFEALGTSTSLGGVSARSSPVRCQRVRASRSGTAYVLWADDSSGDSDVYGRTWNGTQWVDLYGTPGGNLSESGVFSAITGGCWGSMAFDSADRPHALWMQPAPANQPLYLKWWNGTAWQGLGGSATGDGISGPASVWWPKLVLTDADEPIVAWGRGSEVYVSAWTGSAWVGLSGSATYPGISGPGAVASFSHIVRGPGPELYVTWGESSMSPDTAVYMLRWNGLAWVEMAGSASGGGLSGVPGNATYGMVADDRTGRPYVAWESNPGATSTIVIKRWNGAAWELLGGFASLQAAGVALPGARHMAMELDSDGNVWFAWEQDEVVGRNVHLARWDGAAWERMAPAVGGVSQTSAFASYPEIAFGGEPSDTLYLSWFEEATPGDYQVFLRRSSLRAPPPAGPWDYRVGASCAHAPVFAPLPVLALLAWLKASARRRSEARGRHRSVHGCRRTEWEHPRG